MKTIKATFLVLAIGLIANVAFATGNLRVNMANADADLAILEATNAKMDLYEISVLDYDGDVIFSKKTEAAADYKKLYDFSLLEDGTYYLDLRHGNERYFKQFEIDLGKVEVMSQRKIAEPFVQLNNDVLKVSYLNFNQDKMGLYIYDENDLLFEKKPETRFAVHEGLDLSQLTAGKYTVVFATEFDNYEYDITIE